MKDIVLPEIEEFGEHVLGTIWDYFVGANKELLLTTFAKKYSDFVGCNSFIARKIKAKKNTLFELAVKNDDPQILEFLFSLFKKVSLDDIDKYIEQSASAVSVTAFLLDYKMKTYPLDKQKKI